MQVLVKTEPDEMHVDGQAPDEAAATVSGLLAACVTSRQ